MTVKLIDRGDEICVDTSELLQIDKKSSSLAAFAQPFRLHDFDGSVRAQERNSVHDELFSGNIF